MTSNNALNSAREHYKRGCQGYLWLFCYKHNLDIRETQWEDDRVGGLLKCPLGYYSMREIIKDVEEYD